MNARGLNRHPLFILLVACAVFPLLLSACQPVQPNATQPPANTQPPAVTSSDITLDLAGVAQDQMIETVAAVPAGTDGPAAAVAPEHRRLTLQGYPVTGSSRNPQIFIYPVAGLADFSQVADLQSLLQTRQSVNPMPFLPRTGDVQALQAQVQFLDFKSGKGVRYLTQYAQGPVPVNNIGLFYTFQGLTTDGNYYIAAVLPLNHPELPNSQEVQAEIVEANQFPAYLSETVSWLNQQPAGSFTPDLAKLDALIQSIEIK